MHARSGVSIRRGKLPTPLANLVGRERELADLRTLLVDTGARLVTLTGPGGVGKTRLAVEVATVAISSFQDGARFVPLGEITEPDLVASTVAAALSVREVGDTPIIDRLAAHLHGERLLLVLDNFEQVVESAPLLADLLTACPDLTLLVTSRVRLRVSGEREYPVLPLPLPSSGRGTVTDTMSTSDAVQLFVDRARSVKPEFQLTSENVAAVADICQRLDGLPLAIELAAARIKVLPPAALLSRLERRLPLLTDGGRDLPERQRTMRDAIAWSYALLSLGEQMLFCRLSVFFGGFDLEAAEAVSGTKDVDLLHGVASLIDKSFLWQGQGPTDEPRYHFLETIREFGLERLAATGEDPAIRRAHTSFFLQLAERFQMSPYREDGHVALGRLEAEHPNLRVALAWAELSGDAETFLRLAGSLRELWWVHGHLREGRARLLRAATHGHRATKSARANVLFGLAAMAHLQGDEIGALPLVEEALALTHEEEEPARMFIGLIVRALILLRLGDLASSAANQERALALVRKIDGADWARRAESSVLANLGNVAVARGDIAGAEGYFQAALDVQQTLGYEPGTSHVTANHALAGLGDVARAYGDHRRALNCYQAALRLAQRFDDARASAYALGGVAGTLAAAGQWEQAARLYGADEAFHEAADLPFDLETMDRQRALGLPEPWQRADESFGCGQALRDALGDRVATIAVLPNPVAAAAAWEAGRGLAMELAVAVAISAALSTAGLSVPLAGSPERLTPREVEVLRLLAEGLTDAQIAHRLRVSRRTAATHVAHIYSKLGVGSRAAAAAWAVRHDLA